jgi:hypothetical protein
VQHSTQHVLLLKIKKHITETKIKKQMKKEQEAYAHYKETSQHWDSTNNTKRAFSLSLSYLKNTHWFSTHLGARDQHLL